MSEQEANGGVDSNGTKKTDVDETKINLNDFLEVCVVSCHLNSCIMQEYRSMKDPAPTGATAAPTAAKASGVVPPQLDFDKLLENRLVNDLLRSGSSKKQAHPRKNKDGGGGEEGLSLEHTRTPRRLSSFGANASAAYYARNNNAVAQKSIAEGASATTTDKPGCSGLHPKLEEKLDFVINEGVLDAVLPFICPVPVPPIKAPARAKVKGRGESQPAAGGKAAADSPTMVPAAENEGKDAPAKLNPHRRKSLLPLGVLKGHQTCEKKESEVIIHVCDEVKNATRDFVCAQSLLVSKMGYFADVTAGQKLEDMDISVHCDIQIFDWLMKWVKCSSAAPDSAALCGSGSGPGGPQLDAGNVVPILVSASFLQMEPLLLDCLAFCHGRLSDVVRASANLSCLNEAIIARLAAMFTNLELEAVRDKKERVTPRLWTKLIQSLAEPETEALRGHYFSLSGLFRCTKCGKCLTNSSKSYIACLPSQMRLNRWGQLLSHHVRDSAWEIGAHIALLYRELKSWRRVYWRLWGHCHCLFCCICETHFPVYQMTWCRFHPEPPNYLGPATEGRLAGPAGRHPCCGQLAFRYETLPGPNGCQFREHSVLVETDRERAILATAQLVGEGHALYEAVPLKLQEALASVDTAEPRWAGLPLTPHCRQGLLPPLNPDESTARLARRVRHGMSAYFADSSSETDTSDTATGGEEASGYSTARRLARRRRYLGGGGCRSSTSSDGCESDDCSSRVPKASVYPAKKAPGGGGGKKRQADIPGRYWCGELSARSNQDHQREFEEKVMKQVIALVSKKTGSEHSLAPAAPVGGSYLRLEAEWKDQLKQRNSSTSIGNANSTANSTSGTNNSNNSNNFNGATGGFAGRKAK